MAPIRGKSILVLLVCLLPAAGWARSKVRLGPPLRVDRDNRDIPKPKEREVSELYAIVYNSWLRHLTPEHHAAAAKDSGALNVNAWDEVPESTWFTNRAGERALSFDQIAGSLAGSSPSPGPWTVLRVRDEGYTPKVDIADQARRRYILKFDLATALERNSAAERISTLILHAAGYNVPHNSIVYFRAGDLRLDEKAYYRDAVGKRRPLTASGLAEVLARLKPLADGRYRGLASQLLPGTPVGQFVYCGRRKDDANDLIPHELRRELRGLRVIAAWINHVDVGDKNALDIYVASGENKGFVKHFLLDFGSSLGSGDFVNGPYRVGHEYIFDGAAMSRSFLTLGVWRRPWETRGSIRFPEVGYFQAEIFEPRQWKPNYPNLAFERMDEGDAYWGAKIVTSFSDECVRALVSAGEYSRAEVAALVAEVLRKRRDAVGRYWLDRVTPLEGLTLEGGRLRFRDLAVERGVASGKRSYRSWTEDLEGKRLSQPLTSQGDGCAVTVPALAGGKPDRYGRVPLARLLIQSSRREGGWALPVEVVLGRGRDSSNPEILGWRHAPR